MTRVNPIWRACIVLAAAAQGVWALDYVAVVRPSDVPAGWSNGFGLSVALSGDYIAVGAPYDPYYNDQQTGAVYLFRRQGRRWIEHVKLTVPGEMWNKFGHSVALDGDVLAAGAPYLIDGHVGEGGPGAVYIYRRDDRDTPEDPTDDLWLQEAVLTSPQGYVDRSFGWLVAMSHGLLATGHFWADTVELFRWKPSEPETWQHEATFTAPELGRGFGSAMDVNGDRVVVGAYYNTEAPGSAYVFAKQETGWIKEDVLSPTDHTTPDGFGFSVSLSGNHIVVGTNIGRAYIYQRKGPTEWIEEQRLPITPPAPGARFGSQVAIDADLVVGGEQGAPPALVFEHESGTWQHSADLNSWSAWITPLLAVEGRFATVATAVYAVRGRNDLKDHAAFQNCFGVSAPWTQAPPCEPFDLTGDGHLDLGDFEDLVGTLTGP
jgi:hypothetical protein